MPNSALGTSVVFVATVLDNRTFSPEVSDEQEEDASSLLLLVVDDAFLPKRMSAQHEANIVVSSSSRCFVICIDRSIRKARVVVVM